MQILTGLAKKAPGFVILPQARDDKFVCSLTSPGLVIEKWNGVIHPAGIISPTTPTKAWWPGRLPARLAALLSATF